MKRYFPVAIAAAILAAFLLQQTASAVDTDFGIKIAGEVTQSGPYGATDYIPLVRGGASNATVKVLANQFVTLADTQTLTNKTLDCNNNTCTNFPAGNTGLSGMTAGQVPLAGSATTITSSFALGTGVQTFLTTPSSANLLAALTTKTGTGSAVFGTSPSLTTPTIAGGALSGTFSGSPTLSGVPKFTGLSAGTIAAGKNLGLDASNNLVTATVGGGGTIASTTSTLAGDGAGNAVAVTGTGTNCVLVNGTSSACGGAGSVGVGVQGSQSPSNIGDNITALPSGHYYYATNANMTAQRTHNLPDSATQGVGDLEIFDAQQTVTATNQLCVTAAGTDKVNTVTNGTACISVAGGSLYLHNDGAGGYTTGAGANIPAPTNGQILIGKTGSPANTIAAATMSQDCTITNAGVITCTKTSNVSFGALATTVAGSNVATAAAVALSGNGGLTKTVFSGAKALATGAISSAACTSAQTDTATGTLTTDVVLASFNGDPTAVTGYVPLTTGMLTIIAYPTADTVNFRVCNNTNASVTPGAITLNWRVVR